MSCIIETIITCDGCGENNCADDRYKTAKSIRASRARSGWVYSGGKDYCEECAARLGLRVRRPNTKIRGGEHQAPHSP